MASEVFVALLTLGIARLGQCLGHLEASSAAFSLEALVWCYRESTPFWNADNYCGQISTIRQQSYFGCSSGIAKLQPISYQELFPL
jgi:hypothetical protein